MAQDLADKLTQARTRLLLDHPFLGALALRLPLVAADWCQRAGSDARNFYYNPQYVAALSVGQLEFIIAQETLRCALAHFSRRGHRQPYRWQRACDFAIVPILLEQGLRPPPDVPLFIEYQGMTAEEIYPLLDQDEQEQPAGGGSGQTGGGAGQHAADPGRQMPQPPTPAEQEQLAMQWRQRVAGAAQQAQQAGKLHGELARVVQSFLHPQLPWRALLAKYMSLSGRDDYSYERPSRREGEAILPSRRSREVQVTVVVDSSGSLSDGEISEFLSEINALKGQVRAGIVLLACDHQLAADCPWEFAVWEDVHLPRQITGGGGTSFLPPFAWQQRQDRQPDVLVYFTDANGEFPPRPPAYPVIWLVKGRAAVPWGRRIQLN